MLGHWEVRRRTDETDTDANRKIHAAFQVGLRPILLVGEAATEQGWTENPLEARLPHPFADCEQERVVQIEA